MSANSKCERGQPQPPSVTQWYRETFRVFPMERLSAVLKGNTMLSMMYGNLDYLDYLPNDLVELLQKGRPLTNK